MQLLIPDTIAAPASRYSHGVLIPAGTRRLVVSGQIGVRPDGTLADDFAAQAEQCWRNLFAVLDSAGMTKHDLTRVTAFVTRHDVLGTFRAVRDRMLEGHTPAATYLVVAGLASPEFQVEIEAEAAAV